MYHYEESHYIKVADRYVRSGNYTNLIQRVGFEELINHISTVFYTDFNEIHVGVSDPALQRHIGKGLVGMTPKFPIHHNDATADDQKLIKAWMQKLEDNNIAYIPCKGRARDYRDGGDGCFILCDVTPKEVMSLLLENGLPTQLSIVYLPPQGEAHLVSCVETNNSDLSLISV
jgi:hypothetical protein